MRKTMKTAAVVAAMSAMTVASASVAFAATATKENISSTDVAVEKTEDAASVGTWTEDATGWTFSIDGKNLKDTWAEIDNVWYYFDGEYMVQEDFLYLDDKGYYFDKNGTLATGWQKITSDTDAYDEIEISDQLTGNYQDWYEGSNYQYDYYDYIWCYFHEDGTAAENEWFQDDTGYHYYFDGHVMVMNMMDFIINPDNYDYADSDSYELFGFDEDGHMLTGWNYLIRKSDQWNGPTREEDTNKTWYYYDMDGTMQKTGWAKIGDNWYLFDEYDEAGLTTDYDDHASANASDFGYPLIVNSHVTSYKNGTTVEEFYMKKDGKLALGVTKLEDKAWDITFYDDDKTILADYENDSCSAKKLYAYFDTKTGKGTGDKVVDNQYFAKKVYDKTKGIEDEDVVVPVEGEDSDKRVTASVQSYVGAITAVTGSGVMKISEAAGVDDFNAEVEGQRVVNAFIGVDADTLYLADEDGKLVKNKAVLFANDAEIEYGDTMYNNAYILFSNNGKAYDGYTGKTKGISIGGVKYWATTEEATVGNAKVTVFVSSKELNGVK